MSRKSSEVFLYLYSYYVTMLLTLYNGPSFSDNNVNLSYIIAVR